jgi:hypothetical protein
MRCTRGIAQRAKARPYSDLAGTLPRNNIIVVLHHTVRSHNAQRKSEKFLSEHTEPPWYKRRVITLRLQRQTLALSVPHKQGVPP